MVGKSALMRGIFLHILGAFTCGCGTTESSPDAVAGGAGTEVGARYGDLDFGACPESLPGRALDRHCATVPMPLFGDEPDGRAIDVMLVVYPAASEGRGQLYLLDGGPGGTGATYMSDEMLGLYQQLGLTIFIPQHRGTGHSTPLRCDVPNQLEECSDQLLDEWGDGLRAMSSSQAAEDLSRLIERTREPDAKVFVLGISYGTYLAQRFLAQYPNQVDGVMMDGVLPLDANLTESDPLAHQAGLRLLEDCGNVPACRSALGDDPLTTVNSVLAMAEEPSARCLGDDGLDRRDLSILFSMMMAMEVPALVPAVVLREARCSASDARELTSMIEAVTEVAGGNSEIDWERMNPVLQYHVVRTDMLALLESIDTTRLVAARDALVVRSAAASVEWFAELLARWGVNYPSASRELLRPATPVLLMNGTYDVQTPLPWVDELAAHYGTTGITVPTAGHGVDISLWLANPASVPCSVSIKKAFVENPLELPDLGCLEQLPATDFAAEREQTQDYAEFFFGTRELLPEVDSSRRSTRVVGTPVKSSPEVLRRALRERLEGLRSSIPPSSRFRG